MRKNIFKLFAMMTLAVSSFSCIDSSTPDTYLGFSSDDKSVESLEGEFTTNLVTNKAWTANDIPEWVTLTPSEGKGNTSIKITYAANEAPDDREAKITFTAGESTKSKIFTIAQEGKEAPDSKNITFQDPAFKAILLDPPLPTSMPNEEKAKYIADADGDGEITYDEAAKITHMTVAEHRNGKGEIKAMHELQYFTSLVELNCLNNAITTLDLSNNSELKHLDCRFNAIATLDVSMLTKLEKRRLACGFQGDQKKITVTMTAAQKALPVTEDSGTDDRITVVTK